MKLVKIVSFFLLSFLFLIPVSRVLGEECQGISDLNARISCYSDVLNRLGSQANTLKNQIAQFDAQIKLTTLKISQTEEKIALLGGRIDQLEASLDALTKAFSSRAVETYKMTRFGDPLMLVFTSGDLTEAVSRFHYLQKIQDADRDLLERLQTAQTTYKGQKADQEDLQKQLEQQKKDLNNQKQAKANLLAITRNDERKYQELLAEARAELAAVQGLGKETFLRDVGEGEKIGTLLSGASGCSSGTHLHFEVHQGGNYQDPNNFLRSISFTYDYGSDQYDYYGTISPHGPWNWPLSEPIVITQGFGSSGFAKIAYPYTGGVHTGIDMQSKSSNDVKAVKAGKLYGGSYQCRNGMLLYAKVDQGDGMTSWYLHMSPQ